MLSAQSVLLVLDVDLVSLHKPLLLIAAKAMIKL